VGIVTGLLLGSVLASGAPPTKTFNIITYHWGYALYDEDWNEIKQMEVKRGTTVRLVAFPQSVLPNEIREQLWQRTVDNGFGEFPPGDPRIADLIEAAYADPTSANHGVFIGQLNVDLGPKENASSLEEAIDSIEFTTDAIGTFDIVCSVFCGVGHPNMGLQGALVVE
jgi:hypothetical protein